MNTTAIKTKATNKDAENMGAFFLTNEKNRELVKALKHEIAAGGFKVRVENETSETIEFVYYRKDRETGERFRICIYRALRKDRNTWIVRYVRNLFLAETA